MPTATAVNDEFISHQIGLQHYANSVVRDVVRHLSDVQADVENELLSGPSVSRSEVLRKKLIVIRDMQRESEGVLRGLLEEGFGGAVTQEAEFLRQFYGKGRGLEATLEYPSAAMLVASALSAPMSNQHLKSWTRKLTSDQIREVDRQIRMSVTLGEGVPEVVNRLRGSVGAVGTDSVWARSKRSAEALVRTGISHVTNVAHKDFIDRNADVFTHFVHVSVLDGRTSAICMERHGHVYKVDDGDIRVPPLHVGCRSTLVGVPAGTKPEDLGFGDFGDWLGRQSDSKVEDVLGKKRAVLYRDGKLKVERFTNNQGKLLTLEQLRVQESKAWGKAFGESGGRAK